VRVRSIRTKRRLLALVLPLLLVRLLVPAGFMPMAGAGGFGVALCPGEAALPPGLMAAHAGHHMHHAAHPGGTEPPASEHHAPCLFAAGAAPPVSPATLLAAAAPAALAAAPLPAQARDVSLPVIQRAQSARAPPEALSA
jgi:hypothetical protein